MSANSSDGDVLLSEILAVLKSQAKVTTADNEDSIASTTNLIALSALVVAVVAFFVTFMQVVFDYTRSNEAARSRCNRAAIGLASQRTVKRWAWRSWRRKYYYPQLNFDSDSLISAIHPSTSFRGFGMSSFRRLLLVSFSRYPTHQPKKGPSSPRLVLMFIWSMFMMIMLEIESIVNKSIFSMTRLLHLEPLIDRPRATWAQSLELLQVRNIDSMMSQTRVRINADSLPTAIDVPVQYINMRDLGILSYLLGCRWVSIDRNALKFSAAGPRVVVSTEELPAFGKVVRFQHTVAQTNTERWDLLLRLENTIKANLELHRFWTDTASGYWKSFGPELNLALLPGSTSCKTYMHQTVDLLLGKIHCGSTVFPPDELSFFEIDEKIRLRWCSVPELDVLLEERDLHVEAEKMASIIRGTTQEDRWWVCFERWKEETSSNPPPGRGLPRLGHDPIILTIGCYASLPTSVAGCPASVILFPFLEFYYKVFLTAREKLLVASSSVQDVRRLDVAYEPNQWDCAMGWSGPGVPCVFYLVSHLHILHDDIPLRIRNILEDFEPFEETDEPVQTVRLGPGITSARVEYLLGHTDAVIQLLISKLEHTKGLDRDLDMWIRERDRQRGIPRPGSPTPAFRFSFDIIGNIVAAIAKSNELGQEEEGDTAKPLGRLEGKLHAVFRPKDGSPYTEERREQVVLLSNMLKLRTCLFGIFLLTVPDSSVLLHAHNTQTILPMV